MTIGIAAAGPRAGLGVFDALRAVERVGRGHIGGFAVLAVLTADGRLLRRETQRGGTVALLEGADSLPAEIAEAPRAALMSSGPDRPAPLAAFLPGEAGVGLVTGHRFPNAPAASGRPLNEEVLELLRQGADARRAVEQVMADNPLADAGVIAIDPAGGLHGANSDRVQSRPDLGSARRACGRRGIVIEVLHNAIFPRAPLAALAAEIAFDRMDLSGEPTQRLKLRSGTPIAAGEREAVVLDEEGRVLRIVTADPRILRGRWNCASPYLGAQVVAGDRLLGHTIEEANVVVQDGKIRSVEGRCERDVQYGKKGRSPDTVETGDYLPTDASS